MDIAIDNLTVKTVPNNYSWDRSIPTESTVVNGELSGNRYRGYAPFVSVLFATTSDNLSGTIIATSTTADYGDYYNSETSVQTSIVTTSATQTFCHNYLMPGLYQIKCTQTRYSTIFDGDRCAGGTLVPYNEYIERQTLDINRPPFSWMWYNFLKDDYEPRTEFFSSYEPRNEFLTWDDCVFQGSKEVTWEQASGPAFEIRTTPVSWQWKKIKPEPAMFELHTQNTSWKETNIKADFPRTWKQVKSYNCSSIKDGAACLELVPSLSSYTVSQTLTALIEVVEIPPTAAIKVLHSQNVNQRISPYTVTLSPRLIRCGSFPIDKILWDLGDGTPILEKSRYNQEQLFEENIKFTHSGIFESDFLDPRNYDLTYTYKRTSETGNCFYPSITAIASSTGTYDCSVTIVGPIKYIPESETRFKLTQNYLSPKGVAYGGVINNTAVFWNRNK